MKKGDYNISEDKEKEWQDFMKEVRAENMNFLAIRNEPRN